ncbi:hypothetical protein WICANDRAFT_60744 [Wickerhamomyces anomalus NRRL Y-366-8]|uniref:Uncharacterized protein n=1 Tax=Wickerhamomyces anomalus (strain ATCC 58044 / CBS 1984 / NCYC 433 / NRRL Y-366-8) TaxID=683960 RepID=A0A1E3PCS9_WICAA|nr:uncharacterized protein WICANDRAFT_60744 [Wickerhamomyces anomalus NRRL Y-366-8]ODQ62687.1 hypothetical protein WICANDRAFT_60744 [Wickerhamomyces anomalus NRRL Y-366-8]
MFTKISGRKKYIWSASLLPSTDFNQRWSSSGSKALKTLSSNKLVSSFSSKTNTIHSKYLFTKSEKGYISQSDKYSTINSQTSELPPKLNYDDYLHSDEKPTFEGLAEFINKYIISRIIKDESFSEAATSIAARIFMSSPSPTRSGWKRFPYHNQNQKLLSIEEGTKFRKISEVEILNQFADKSNIKDGIAKVFNDLQQYYFKKAQDDSNSHEKRIINIFDMVDSMRKLPTALREPANKQEIQSLSLSYVIHPLVQVINDVYDSKLVVLQQRYVSGRKSPDVIIQDEDSKAFSVLEFENNLPKAENIKSMKSAELLDLQGFKQTLYSIAMSNTNMGVLSSFGTTLIIEVDWKKSCFDGTDTCKLALELFIIDHNEPLTTLKSTIMHFLTKLLVLSTSEEKDKIMKTSLESRTKMIINCEETQQKHSQQLRKSFLRQYQNDSRYLNKEVIDVRLDLQDDKSSTDLKNVFRDMTEKAKYIILKKKHFLANNIVDAVDDDEEVVVKWYEPITHELTDNPLLNQELLEQDYLDEMYELKKLERIENSKNLELSKLRLFKNGFMIIKDQYSNIVAIGNYLAMANKNPKTNKNEITKRLPILTKSDILSEAMNRLECLHSNGFALNQNVDQRVVVNNGDVSILATTKYGDEVPDRIKDLDTKTLGQIVASGRIIQL